MHESNFFNFTGSETFFRVEKLIFDTLCNSILNWWISIIIIVCEPFCTFLVKICFFPHVYCNFNIWIVVKKWINNLLNFLFEQWIMIRKKETSFDNYHLFILCLIYFLSLIICQITHLISAIFLFVLVRSINEIF